MTFTFSRRALRIAVGLASAAGLLAIGAAVSNSNSTAKNYTGCLKRGELIKVAVGKKPMKPCGKAKTVRWNAKGQPGAPGADGAPGAQGPAGSDGSQGPPGADGSDGVSGWQKMNALTAIAANGTATQAVWCPSGKVATGGGWGVDNALLNDVIVRSSTPVESSGFHAWQATVDNTGSGTGNLYVYVFCANAN